MFTSCNISLINETKPKLAESKLYEKLQQFKNPFSLILHNADDSFENYHLKYLNIPNCRKVYSQNVNTLDSRVEFLPIGIANHFWKWGDTKKVVDVILEDMSMDSGDNVVWFQNDDGHYLIKKVQVDILD